MEIFAETQRPFDTRHATTCGLSTFLPADLDSLRAKSAPKRETNARYLKKIRKDPVRLTIRQAKRREYQRAYRATKRGRVKK